MSVIKINNTCAACGCAIRLELSEVPTFRGYPAPATYAEFFAKPGGNPTCSVCFAKKRASEQQGNNKKNIVSHWKRVEPSQK